ncbi:helix-turn-helix domain-containing protein [Sphingopyxis sp. UBA6723]
MRGRDCDSVNKTGTTPAVHAQIAAQLCALVSADCVDAVILGAPATESLGDRLHRFRTARRLTLGHIGIELAMSEQSISAWEQGKARPKPRRANGDDQPMPRGQGAASWRRHSCKSGNRARSHGHRPPASSPTPSAR